MYFFARETKHTFFIEPKRSTMPSNEPMAIEDPTMDEPIPLSDKPMAEHGQNGQKLIKKKTKRGKGKRKSNKLICLC